MIVLLSLFIGAVIGAFRAKKRGGNRLDMLQYGAVFAIIGAITGLFLTILIESLI